MRTEPLLRLTLVTTLAAAFLAGCGGAASPPTGSSNATTPGAMMMGSKVPVHYMLTIAGARRQSAIMPNLLLTYSGGPAFTTAKAYLILWGFKRYGDKDKVAPLLERYLAAAGGSGHNNIYTQYYEHVGGRLYYIQNKKNQYGGVWDDEKTTVPLSPTQTQIADEALNGVKHFGYDANGSYIVATPQGRSQVGFGSLWCAYHSGAIYKNQGLSYTYLAYMPDGGISCGARLVPPPKGESSIDEGVTIVEGHEFGESVTDPVLYESWYNYTYGELGDMCAWQDIANDPFGKESFTMQPMFSNASQSCVHSY